MKFLTLLVTIYLTMSQVQPLTEAELTAYIKSGRIEVVDYRMLDETSAILLEIDGEQASAYKVFKQSDNSIVQESVSYSWGQKDDGISVKSNNGYLCVAVHEQALPQKIESVNVHYSDEEGNRKKDTYELNGKRGLLIELLPEYEGGGAVSVYGSDGFVGDYVFYN
ncbi:hypothetical protein [Paenibacillus donghaensis]|uniref:Uncharacterized protein n=1 Tax=Paenibacillus donghaensis TaxID=414771 RepID=A0A2Z2KDG6_9BACL|nr:hypothetical protein [Paenibacillus donghaensis]ASA24766.1 hypothetical protein B9T62_30820 [Paenibacillus donghaensis]